MINKRRLFVFLFIILILSGVIVTALGIVFYSYAKPPTFSSNPYYRGLGIAQNSTVFSSSMTIGLQVSPPEFSFQYFFIASPNGTYNFVFEFPFKVLSTVRVSENFSVNSTDTCTVISASHLNATQGSGEGVGGWFIIDPTFLSGNRGLYTIVLPFGNPFISELFGKSAEELGVTSYQPNAQIKMNIVLPDSTSWTQSFPTMTGMEPFTFTDKPTTSLYWNFDNLQNLQGSITVEYENQSQIENYESWTFLSGIFIGIGSSLIISSVYEVLTKLSEKAQKYTE